MSKTPELSGCKLPDSENIREGLKNLPLTLTGTDSPMRLDDKDVSLILSHLKSHIEQTPCFYAEDIFPTTIEEAGKLLREKGLTDLEITAISGCIARLGWNNCLKTITEGLE